MSLEIAPHDCCPEARDRIWIKDGVWLYDDSPGYRGTPIKFCPFCGSELK